MMAYAVPHYEVPCRTTMTNRLNTKYKKVSSKYREVLKKVGNMTLSSDIWTDTLNTRSFLGVSQGSVVVGEQGMELNENGLLILKYITFIQKT